MIPFIRWLPKISEWKNINYGLSGHTVLLHPFQNNAWEFFKMDILLMGINDTFGSSQYHNSSHWNYLFITIIISNFEHGVHAFLCMCTRIHTHMHECEPLCVWGGAHRLLGIILHGSSTLFIEVRSFNQMRSSPIWPVYLDSLLWKFSVSARPEIMWVLGIQILIFMFVQKGFNPWATSSVLSSRLFKN